MEERNKPTVKIKASQFSEITQKQRDAISSVFVDDYIREIKLWDPQKVIDKIDERKNMEEKYSWEIFMKLIEKWYTNDTLIKTLGKGTLSLLENTYKKENIITKDTWENNNEEEKKKQIQKCLWENYNKNILGEYKSLIEDMIQKKGIADLSRLKYLGTLEPDFIRIGSLNNIKAYKEIYDQPEILESVYSFYRQRSSNNKYKESRSNIRNFDEIVKVYQEYQNFDLIKELEECIPQDLFLKENRMRNFYKKTFANKEKWKNLKTLRKEINQKRSLLIWSEDIRTFVKTTENIDIEKTLQMVDQWLIRNGYSLKKYSKILDSWLENEFSTSAKKWKKKWLDKYISLSSACDIFIKDKEFDFEKHAMMLKKWEEEWITGMKPDVVRDILTEGNNLDFTKIEGMLKNGEISGQDQYTVKELLKTNKFEKAVDLIQKMKKSWTKNFAKIEYIGKWLMLNENTEEIIETFIKEDVTSYRDNDRETKAFVDMIQDNKKIAKVKEIHKRRKEKNIQHLFNIEGILRLYEKFWEDFNRKKLEEWIQSWMLYNLNLVINLQDKRPEIIDQLLNNDKVKTLYKEFQDKLIVERRNPINIAHLLSKDKDFDLSPYIELCQQGLFTKEDWEYIDDYTRKNKKHEKKEDKERITNTVKLAKKFKNKWLGWYRNFTKAAKLLGKRPDYNFKFAYKMASWGIIEWKYEKAENKQTRTSLMNMTEQDEIQLTERHKEWILKKWDLEYIWDLTEEEKVKLTQLIAKYKEERWNNISIKWISNILYRNYNFPFESVGAIITKKGEKLSEDDWEYMEKVQRLNLGFKIGDIAKSTKELSPRDVYNALNIDKSYTIEQIDDISHILQSDHFDVNSLKHIIKEYKQLFISKNKKRQEFENFWKIKEFVIEEDVMPFIQKDKSQSFLTKEEKISYINTKNKILQSKDILSKKDYEDLFFIQEHEGRKKEFPFNKKGTKLWKETQWNVGDCYFVALFGGFKYANPAEVLIRKSIRKIPNGWEVKVPMGWPWAKRISVSQNELNYQENKDGKLYSINAHPDIQDRTSYQSTKQIFRNWPKLFEVAFDKYRNAWNIDKLAIEWWFAQEAAEIMIGNNLIKNKWSINLSTFKTHGIQKAYNLLSKYTQWNVLLFPSIGLKGSNLIKKGEINLYWWHAYSIESVQKSASWPLITVTNPHNTWKQKITVTFEKFIKIFDTLRFVELDLTKIKE